MSGQRRGVTRGYVGGLIFAANVVAASLVVAVWGLISLFSERAPIVTEDVARWVAPVAVIFALGLLAWGLWQQAILLLRGRRSPSWAHLIVLAGAAYLAWCLIGTLGGLSINETWLSPFAVVLAPIWAVASLLFWAVLARRIYTEREVPRWPWERENDDDGLSQ